MLKLRAKDEVNLRVFMALCVLSFLVFVVNGKAYAEVETKNTEFSDDLNVHTLSPHTNSHLKEHSHPYEDKYFPDTHSTDKTALDTKLGAKIDAPNIVKLSKNSSIGVEGGKDFLDTGLDGGWFVFGKFTWTGTLFDFIKKE